MKCNSKKIIILLGIPHSGKTTFSNYINKKYNYSIVSTDEIKHRIYGNNKYDIKTLFKYQKKELIELMSKGIPIVADSNNSKDIYRKEIIELAIKYHYQYFIVHIYSDLNTIKQRLEDDNKHHILSNINYYIDELDFAGVNYEIYNDNTNEYFNKIDDIMEVIK